jgi:hypothetical protein
MKRLAVALISTCLVMGATGMSFALTSTGIEEAFVDAVGSCGPSSNVAGTLGKSEDPAVRLALRNALIIEAADDAAGAPGANKAHSECIKKDLTTRGLTADQMAALPTCVKNAWPEPFDNLGTCVMTHSRLEGALKK